MLEAFNQVIWLPIFLATATAMHAVMYAKKVSSSPARLLAPGDNGHRLSGVPVGLAKAKGPPFVRLVFKRARWLFKFATDYEIGKTGPKPTAR
jgi:hypothetical protein